MRKVRKNFLILVPWILLLLGIYLVPLGIFKADFSRIPGDLGDARFNNYILEHGHRYLTGTVHSFWDAPFMYPYKESIAFSDNLLGTMPIYSVFRSVGVNRETSYQLWMLSLFILNFICCYFVLKKWSGTILLSASGAYVFAFSLTLVGNIYNVQTLPRFIFPLVIYWCWRFLTDKKLLHFLLLFFGVVYQLYCGIYLGFFTLYSLLFFIIAYFIVYRELSLFRKFRDFKFTAGIFGVIIMSAVLLAPLMLPYISNAQAHGLRAFSEAVGTIPTLRSYFFTSNESMTWQILAEHGKQIAGPWWCHFLFVGAIPWLAILLLPLVYISKKLSGDQKRFISFTSVVLALNILFCLNVNGRSLYVLIFELPGFSAMRSLNRLINTEVLFFIVLMVFVFRELLSKYNYLRWLALLIPFLVVIDNLISPDQLKSFNKNESLVRINKVRNDILRTMSLGDTTSAIAYVPLKEEGEKVEKNLDVMLAVQELNLPCVNAYSASIPLGLLEFYKWGAEEGLKKWCDLNNIDRESVVLVTDFDREVKKVKRVALQIDSGKYLSADDNLSPNLIANRSNPYAWETYKLIDLGNDECMIICHNGSILGLVEDTKPNIMRYHANTGEHLILKIRYLEDNKVSFKASNDKYMGADNLHFLTAVSDTVGIRQQFVLAEPAIY